MKTENTAWSVYLFFFFNYLTARIVRWLGNWLPRTMSWVRFPHRPNLCMIQKLLFWVEVSRVCELVCLKNATTTQEKILLGRKCDCRTRDLAFDSRVGQNITGLLKKISVVAWSLKLCPVCGNRLTPNYMGLNTNSEKRVHIN
ncbi:hypothetical protein SFRURICE_005603 [Spodoptera frugiperda]|nr:hypothetical protein SFRURICE_005603 [Spodoptera frugiperda]